MHTGSRYDLDREAIAALISDLGEPRYRVDQLWQGLYQRLAEPSELTNLPRGLRAALDEDPRMARALHEVRVSVGDHGNTLKWLWQLTDGPRIETVLMHYPGRSTVCISTQAGCAMGCGFCATGQMGFERHLSAGEILEQVVLASRRAQESGRRVTRVVSMGMGEPLANYDNTLAAIGRMHRDLGLSARHLTVSTVGIVPGIRRLAREPLPITLAISLHAANDPLRDRLVPINRRYPLAELLAACEEFRAAGGRRLTLEWALIDGTNDRQSDALELAEIARRLRAHVNLIPLNATPGASERPTPKADIRAFRGWLESFGVNATVRQTRGADIDAACGQLAAISGVSPVGH